MSEAGIQVRNRRKTRCNESRGGPSCWRSGAGSVNRQCYQVASDIGGGTGGASTSGNDCLWKDILLSAVGPVGLSKAVRDIGRSQGGDDGRWLRRLADSLRILDWRWRVTDPTGSLGGVMTC